MAIFTGRATGAFGGTIAFEWEPDPDVIAAELVRTADSLEDRRIPLTLARQIAVNEHLDHFQEQRGPDGEAWVPWSKSYYPTAVVNNVGDILERTMSLEEAMVSPEAYPITTDSVFFATGGLPEYWMWNQEGTGNASNWGFVDSARERIAASGLAAERDVGFGIGKGQALPARPFVGMSVEAQLKILEVFELWFDNVVSSTFVRGGRTVIAERGAGGRFTGRQVIT